MKNTIKYIILCFMFTASITVTHNLDRDTIVQIETEQDLKNLLENNIGPSAISFHMDSCGWCMKMHPIFESFARDNQFNHITFYSVNGPILKAHTHVKEILNKTVTGYPTIFFMNQGKLIDKQVGGAPSDILIKKLNGLSSSPEKTKKIPKVKIKRKETQSRKQKMIVAAVASTLTA